MPSKKPLKLWVQNLQNKPPPINTELPTHSLRYNRNNMAEGDSKYRDTPVLDDDDAGFSRLSSMKEEVTWAIENKDVNLRLVNGKYVILRRRMS